MRKEYHIMKEIYTAPVITVIDFETEDVISISDSDEYSKLTSAI